MAQTPAALAQVGSPGRVSRSIVVGAFAQCHDRPLDGRVQRNIKRLSMAPHTEYARAGREVDILAGGTIEPNRLDIMPALDRPTVQALEPQLGREEAVGDGRVARCGDRDVSAFISKLEKVPHRIEARASF